jgi:hypothetical protein
MEEIMLYVQHTIGRLVTHTDVSIDRILSEPERIAGKGEESNESLEVAQRILDCNGEKTTWIYTKSNGRGDQHTTPQRMIKEGSTSSLHSGNKIQLDGKTYSKDGWAGSGKSK